MSQKSSSLEQQNPQPTKMKQQIASFSESDTLTDDREKEMQPPSTDPKCGRNIDHGETETHGSALKRNIEPNFRMNLHLNLVMNNSLTAVLLGSHPQTWSVK
ncbi:hypothetical protein C1H46_018977 [Malus baccata]|uniref:Uncharacterized protein n=1 Tax=Malus baccata TaxID=106549 RepID=A0A540MAC0_MALBA|nr:hypothetical protein C1H46_018977 [Malus baccata]